MLSGFSLFRFPCAGMNYRKYDYPKSGIADSDRIIRLKPNDLIMISIGERGIDYSNCFLNSSKVVLSDSTSALKLATSSSSFSTLSLSAPPRVEREA